MRPSPSALDSTRVEPPRGDLCEQAARRCGLTAGVGAPAHHLAEPRKPARMTFPCSDLRSSRKRRRPQHHDDAAGAGRLDYAQPAVERGGAAARRALLSEVALLSFFPLPPLRPGKPGSPLSPLSPGKPGSPLSPLAPGSPCRPRGPSAPAGPCEASATSSSARGSSGCSPWCRTPRSPSRSRRARGRRSRDSRSPNPVRAP